MLLFILFVALLAVLLGVTYSKSPHKGLKYLVIGVISLYWGFSLINAPDIEGYMFCFDVMGTTGDPYYWLAGLPFHHFEIGFVYYMFLVKKLFDSYYFFQFLTLLIEISITFYGISRLLKNEPLALRILCIFAVQLTLFMAAMRQGFAISLFIASLPFVTEKDYKKFIILNVIGALFHRSIIILILIVALFWLLEKIYGEVRYGKLFMLIVFVVCNVFYFLGYSLSDAISGLSSFFIDEVSLADNRDYSSYIDSLSEDANFGILKVIEMDVCFLIAFLSNRFIYNKENKLILFLFLFYFILNLTVGGLLIHRISYYLFIPYYLVQYFTLSYLVKSLFRCGDSVASYAVFAYIILMFFVQRLASGNYIFEYHLLDLFA